MIAPVWCGVDGPGACGVSPIGVAFVFLLLMMAGFWAGLAVQRSLRDHHRSRESVDSIRVIITLLVTFAALVLGLLISSTQARFTSLEAGLRGLSIDIVELDRRFREYGSAADPMRADLILYTKAAIADTWPDEPRPPGDFAVDRTRLSPGSEENVSLTVRAEPGAAGDPGIDAGRALAPHTGGRSCEPNDGIARSAP
jgi:hypothetical protein